MKVNNMSKANKSRTKIRIATARNKIAMLMYSEGAGGNQWFTKGENQKLANMWDELGKMKDKLK
jgi:hypothetical protein|tara:strand:- start:1201 stop:1392 length:192 start_codon:yes stop_codon:yes gene_type:complete